MAQDREFADVLTDVCRDIETITRESATAIKRDSGHGEVEIVVRIAPNCMIVAAPNRATRRYALRQ